jgi:hypothetical protein
LSADKTGGGLTKKCNKMLPFFPVEIFFLLIGVMILTPFVLVLLLKSLDVLRIKNKTLKIICYFLCYVGFFIITILIIRTRNTAVLDGLIVFNIIAIIGLIMNRFFKAKRH